MAIVKPSSKTRSPTADVDAFISGAPDSNPGQVKDVRKPVVKGKKEQISLTIRTDLLNEIDQLASKMGQTRAGLINLAVYRLIEEERSKA